MEQMDYIFAISVDDVQLNAIERIGRPLTKDEIRFVSKGVEFGLECWWDVVNYAIDGLEDMEYSHNPSLN